MRADRRSRPERRVRATVRWGDRVARVLITAGGLGTVVAVLGVCVFLVVSALPLFKSARVENERPFAIGPQVADVVETRVDDDMVVSWSLHSDGRLDVHRFEDGRIIRRHAAPSGPTVTAMAVSVSGDALVLGFEDGSLRTGRVRFTSEFFEVDEVPESLALSGPGMAGIWEGAVLIKTPDGQFRRDGVAFDLDESFATGDAAIRMIDLVSPEEGRVVVCTRDDQGRLRETVLTREYNYFTGETRRDATSQRLPSPSQVTSPRWLVVTGLGEQLYCVQEDGRFARIAWNGGREPAVVERGDLTPAGERVTALAPLLGRGTIAVGTDTGGLSTWFRANETRNDSTFSSVDEAERATQAGATKSASSVDGVETRRARVFSESGPAFSRIVGAARSRLLFAARDNGELELHQATTGEQLLALTMPGDESIVAITVAPREEALVAVNSRGTRTWDVDLGHPEVAFSSLFRPVLYEGYRDSEHVWQSTSASDESEPKFGLMPLIFGTLKATFYTLLFGAPIALLAAIYGSEFVSRRNRARIKPAIEMMASLPSVVLGFLAALVFAPFVERIVPQILTGFVTIPFALILGANLWQLAPGARTERFIAARTLSMAVAVLLGGLAAAMAGSAVEELLFAGDIMSWLDGRRGTATGGWMFFTLPVATVVVGILGGRASHPWIFSVSRNWSRARFVGFELLRCVALALAVVALAGLLAWLLTGMGFDPRGTIFGTYIQRNSLVVGFVMGFAVIPIIYTIAEDALTAVPAHLRAASLGAGATPWQTAVRIVVPTAASGLFSAVMIGFGRAVGETMIVLMATGNTPIMDVNIFSGFRTLAANIAVEMPEAPQGGTHYHTLYLAAFTLFVLTFFINALAESVRQRFRRKANEL